MTPILILALAVLQLSDPVADAIGDGSLVPPTAPVYATTANFDLQSVELTDATNLTLRVTLGALDNPGDLSLGFTSPVIEIYLDTEAGGAESLLPGSGMRMPEGQGWEMALRLTGDDAFLVVAQEEGVPSEWPLTPVTVTSEATTLVVTAPVPRPREAEIYAITGVYDAFAADSWREVTRTPTPWGFSSPTQRLPVVDVIAPTQAEQARALQTGVLPRPRSPAYGAGWLVLMLVGVAAATVGLWFRRLAGASRAHAPSGRAAELAAKVAPPRGASAPAPAGPPVVWSPALEPAPEPVPAEADEGVPVPEPVDAPVDAPIDALDDLPGESSAAVLAEAAETSTVAANASEVVEPSAPAARSPDPIERPDALPASTEAAPPATRGATWESVLVDPDDSFLDEEEESLRWLDDGSDADPLEGAEVSPGAQAREADPDPEPAPESEADPDPEPEAAPESEPDADPDPDPRPEPQKVDEGKASQPSKDA